MVTGAWLTCLLTASMFRWNRPTDRDLLEITYWLVLGLIVTHHPGFLVSHSLSRDQVGFGVQLITECLFSVSTLEKKATLRGCPRTMLSQSLKLSSWIYSQQGMIQNSYSSEWYRTAIAGSDTEQLQQPHECLWHTQKQGRQQTKGGWRSVGKSTSLPHEGSITKQWPPK